MERGLRSKASQNQSEAHLGFGVDLGFDFHPRVLMPSTTGIGGSGQKVLEWRLYATSSFGPAKGEEYRVARPKGVL